MTLTKCLIGGRVVTSKAFEIELSWPGRGLNPNGRLHWSKKHKLSKAARKEAAFAAIWAGCKFFEPKGRIRLTWAFHPPVNRPSRNIDNFNAAMKPYLDGIADAMGVDDAVFLDNRPEGFSEVIKGGKVLVTVTDTGE